MDDMDTKPRPPFVPVMIGTLLILASNKDKVFLPAWIEWARMALLVGGGLLVVWGAGQIIHQIIYTLARIAAWARWQWYEPQIRIMENAVKMDSTQIKFAREAGLVHGVISIRPASMVWEYSTPWGVLDPDWINEHLALCRKSWPIFPALRRYREGSLDYKQEYAFNHWMAMWNLAEERPGQEYVWRVTYKEATDRIFGNQEEPEQKETESET